MEEISPNFQVVSSKDSPWWSFWSKKLECTFLTSQHHIWMLSKESRWPNLSEAFKHTTIISFWSNTIFPFWIICLISFAACMVNQVLMVSLPCLSPSEKVSTFSWLDSYPLKTWDSEIKSSPSTFLILLRNIRKTNLVHTSIPRYKIDLALVVQKARRFRTYHRAWIIQNLTNYRFARLKWYRKNNLH